LTHDANPCFNTKVNISLHILVTLANYTSFKTQMNLVDREALLKLNSEYLDDGDVSD
jgi:hypothetical protein